MPKGIWKEPITTFMATVMIAMALVVGFLGGIVFSDRAYRKLGLQGMNSQGQMPPATMNGDLPEGHPPIDQNAAGQGQLPQGHPDVSNMAAGQPNPAEAQKNIDQLQGMLKKDPDNIAVLVNLGNAYFDQQQSQKAVDCYERALKLKPNLPDVWVDCGAMYRDLEKYDKAIEYFKTALKYNPNHAQSYFNMGVVYQFDLVDYPKAIEAWSKYLELNPTFERANEIRKQIADMETMVKTGKKVAGPNATSILEQGGDSSHADPVLARGKSLFINGGCTVCHAVNGVGGRTAPDLTHVANKRTDKYIEKILIAPKSMAPNSNMPAVKLAPKDMDALVKYLGSLK